MILLRTWRQKDILKKKLIQIKMEVIFQSQLRQKEPSVNKHWTKYLEKLNESSSPKWGTLHPSQMLFHCNTFIEVSLGLKKINLITRLSSRLFFRYFFLKYLNYIDFNIYKFKRNSATLPVFKTFPKTLSLIHIWRCRRAI